MGVAATPTPALTHFGVCRSNLTDQPSLVRVRGRVVTCYTASEMSEVVTCNDSTPSSRPRRNIATRSEAAEPKLNLSAVEKKNVVNVDFVSSRPSVQGDAVSGISSSRMSSSSDDASDEEREVVVRRPGAMRK